MITQTVLLTLVLTLFACQSFAATTTQPADAKAMINVLVVTGGHGFNPATFYKLFEDNSEITHTIAAEKNTADAYDRDDLLSYDVIVLYDFQRELTDAQKAKFLSLFDKGIGVVVLHHALLSYQNWPEYERIAGGKYLLDNEKVGDKITPASTYQGNVNIDVKVLAKDHPVTAGVSDFTILDEIYRGVRTTSDITTLMTAEDKPLAWVRTEKQSRVVGIMIGHGPAYADANFQRLLRQSIRWAAKRS
jgi:type 1 glutamine amidotransferase